MKLNRKVRALCWTCRSISVELVWGSDSRDRSQIELSEFLIDCSIGFRVIWMLLIEFVNNGFLN